MYKVMVQIDSDGDFIEEYTGEVYDKYEEAKSEFLKAKEDVQVFSAWIKKVEGR